MRFFGFILGSLFGSGLSSNEVFSTRIGTRVSLLQRKANEFESDARIRFAAEDGVKLDECLAALKRLIHDIATSNRPVHQLELFASRIDSEDLSAGSLSETVANLIIDFASISEIDIMAYPGILDVDRQAHLAGLLRVAFQIGLSRKQVLDSFGELEKSVHRLSESPQPEIDIASVLELLGLNARPGLREIVSAISSGGDFLPHFMSESVTNAWTSTRSEFSQVNLGRAEELLLPEELWEVVNSAHEALTKIPVGFVKLDEELSVFISALSDIAILLNNPTHPVHQEEVVKRIIDNLRPLIPILEGHSNDALSDGSEWRFALMEKVRDSSFPAEAEIILAPLLLRFAKNRLVHFFRCDSQGRAVLTSGLKLRSIASLNIQLDGYIEAIQQRGPQRISVADMIASELESSRVELGTNVFSAAIEERRLLERILRTASDFARNLGIRILQNWSTSERFEQFRIVIAACLELECDRAVTNLVRFTDEELHIAVNVLSGMVARRNFLLSLNEDEPAALVKASHWISARALLLHGEYANWVTNHLFPQQFFQLLPILRQRGFLREHIRNILTNFEPPQRLVWFSKQVEAVYRTFRRKIGGPVGKRLHQTLSSALALPSKLLWFEIKWNVVDANPGIRYALEAVFRNFFELIHIGTAKILTLNQAGKSEETAHTIINALERIQTSLRRIEPIAQPAELGQQAYHALSHSLEAFSADIKRQKEIFQT